MSGSGAPLCPCLTQVPDHAATSYGIGCRKHDAAMDYCASQRSVFTHNLMRSTLACDEPWCYVDAANCAVGNSPSASQRASYSYATCVSSHGGGSKARTRNDNVAMTWSTIHPPKTLMKELRDMCRLEPLHKMVHGSPQRFIVTIGVAHTGHHFWSNVLPRITDVNRWHLLGEFARAQVYHDGELPCLNATRRVPELRDQFLIVNAFARDAKRVGDSPFELIAIEPFASYPTGRRAQQPDVTVLAAAAEAAGSDLRMMLLTRPAEEALPDPLTVQDLEQWLIGCNRLSAQLMSIDPEFYLCFPYSYERLDHLLSLPSTTSWFGSDIKPHFNEHFRRSNHSSGGQAWDRIEKAARGADAIRKLFHQFDDCMRTLEGSICNRPKWHTRPGRADASGGGGDTSA